MRVLNQFFFLLTLTFLVISCGDKPKNPSGPTTGNDTSEISRDGTNPDEDFAMKAGEGGLFEVMAGELAVKKGSSKVRQLGQMMVDDHGKANADLKKIAMDKNIFLPTSLGNDLQKKYDELMAKDGKDFDKTYANLMVEDHKKDIKKFEKESEEGKDPDFKKFASDNLPTLRHHLEMSEDTKKHCDSR